MYGKWVFVGENCNGCLWERIVLGYLWEKMVMGVCGSVLYWGICGRKW